MFELVTYGVMYASESAEDHTILTWASYLEFLQVLLVMIPSESPDVRRVHYLKWSFQHVEHICHAYILL